MESLHLKNSTTAEKQNTKEGPHITISIVGMSPSIQLYGMSVKVQANTLIARVTIISNIKLESTNYVDK